MYNKEYYEENKEKLRIYYKQRWIEQSKERVRCECGELVMKIRKNSHVQSKKHKNNLELNKIID